MADERIDIRLRSCLAYYRSLDSLEESVLSRVAQHADEKVVTAAKMQTEFSKQCILIDVS